MHDSCAHELQRGCGTFDERFRRTEHESKLSGSCADHAAGHGCIDKGAESMLVDTCSYGTGCDRVDGRTVNVKAFGLSRARGKGGGGYICENAADMFWLGKGGYDSVLRISSACIE